MGRRMRARGASRKGPRAGLGSRPFASPQGAAMALINCRECQKQVSTAATQCPHCGAPVSAGAPAASAAPMALPAPNQGYPQQPQAGYPQQPGYPQGGYGQQPPPPKSNCLRNCLILGCLLVILAGCTFFGGMYYIAQRVFKWTPADVTALGQELAPGATAPPGFKAAAGINWDLFG